MRAAVGPRYPIAVKLNSSDFVKGGFTLEDCLKVVRWLGEAGVDFLEVSGGTYERMEFLKAHPEDEIRNSTRLREATFLQYAQAIKAAAAMPIMVTGGFRTRAGMEAALQGGHTDMIGVARPFCLIPDFPRRMMAGELDVLPVPEDRLVLGRGSFGPNSGSDSMRGLNGLAQAGWYYRQIERLARASPRNRRCRRGGVAFASGKRFWPGHGAEVWLGSAGHGASADNWRAGIDQREAGANRHSAPGGAR